MPLVLPVLAVSATVVVLVRVLLQPLVAHVVHLVVVIVAKAHVVLVVLHHLVADVHSVEDHVEVLAADHEEVAKCKPSTFLGTSTSIP